MLSLTYIHSVNDNYENNLTLSVNSQRNHHSPLESKPFPYASVFFLFSLFQKTIKYHIYIGYICDESSAAKYVTRRVKLPTIIL